MIVLDRVTATVAVHSHQAPIYNRTLPVLSSVSLTIPTDRRIALFGAPADKRIFIDLIGGLTVPKSGRIIRKAKVSFPVGHLGSFDHDLPVRHNVAHVARLYDTDPDKMVDFVERVGRFGASFDKPFGQLPGVQRARLGYLVAYSIPFDLYILQEGGVLASQNPRDALTTLVKERLRTSGMILSTRAPKFAAEHCEMALMLKNGELRLYESVQKALTATRRRMLIARRMKGLPQRNAN